MYLNAEIIEMTLLSDNLQVIMKTATSIHLSWTSAGAENVQYYIVLWKTDSKGGCSCLSGKQSNIVSSSSTTNKIMNLEEASHYIITLRTQNSDGITRRNYSVVSVMTLEAGEREPMLSSGYIYVCPIAIPPAPFTPPTSVNVSEVTFSSITVQWGPVDCIHRNGDITGYSVQYGSETVSVSGDSSGGMYVISGLIPSTTYSIQVAAQTSADTGPYSIVVDQMTSSEICAVLQRLLV